MKFDVKVASGILSAKIKGIWTSIESLRTANNILAECCGVYCGQGCSELRLPDTTNNKLQTLYFKGNELYCKVNGTEKKVTIV